MKELFWMMIGICIGTIFHADIPILNNISASKIKGIIGNTSEAVTNGLGHPINLVPTPPPPTNKELRKQKKKSRKDKDLINSVEM
jgi:hypothetical protein